MSRTNRKTALDPARIPAGVIGLGLMGHSIIACLLSSGHPVVAASRDLSKHRGSRRRIRSLLAEMRREKLSRKDPDELVRQLRFTEDYSDLAQCGIVIESIIEDVDLKVEAYRSIEQAVGKDTIIGSNTSSIPVSILQRKLQRPERLVGIHWDEPAHVTRFMEIIAGEKTSRRHAERVMRLAELWGKEPSLLRKEIRGFITNRISYAMFREACYLVDSGVCTVEDVDRSLRNDVGWWMPFAGPFRYMDLMGPAAYCRVMKDLAPELASTTGIPPIMRRVVESGGRGIVNGRGYYKYSPEERKRWEKLFLKFNYEIRQLTQKYDAECGSSKRPKR